MVKVLRALTIAVAVLVLILAGTILVLSDPDIPAAELEKRYASASSRFLDVPSGARAHVRVEGQESGHALVLLHGSNASLHTWAPWVSRLSQDLRLISIDLPGHGLTGPIPSGDYSQASMVALVLEVADALRLDQFAVAGNSMGAGVAARLAITQPSRLTHLILVDGGGMPSKKPRDIGIGFTLARLPVVNNVMRWVSPRSVFESSLKNAIEDDRLVTPGMVDLYWELNRREGQRSASLKRFQLGQDEFNARNMSSIKTKTLILWGEKDRLIPLDAGEAAKAAIPDSKLVVYKNIGQVPQEEVPDASAADVLAFIKNEALPSEANAKE